MSTLVIVESPTKAKTISRFLGKDFIVKSSFGHLRDLPKSKLGVDVKNNFKPEYIVSDAKNSTVKELKTSAKKTSFILFATDEDREGEAISYHLAKILGIKPENAKRIVFHEITKQAIEESLKHPRPLDLKLFNAQQARRVLDRLVGYQLSPFLWRKIAKGLSAGRVQSVAVRLVVEREREIDAFEPQEYWSLDGIFQENDKHEVDNENDSSFIAKLHAIEGKKIHKLDIKNKKQVEKILTDLKDAQYQISNLEQKKKSRNPLPPFTTSTLQQEANHRLGYSAKQTMRLAQQLYEGIAIEGSGQVGLITYMRTDSTNLSGKFLDDAQNYINKEYGAKYCPDKPRIFKKKSKNAQEAHEAIRPTHANYHPESIKNSLNSQQYKLYDLIWRRAMASQMATAEFNATIIDVASNNNYVFRATGQTIVFDGFLKLYPEKSKENILPQITQGKNVDCKELKPEQHFTEPPARYSDATLVKTLEEHGIGRPSTYAPTIHTIEERKYVERDDNKRLKPTDIAYVVNDLLVEHFQKIVDLEFTADMEQNFDDIAEGKKEWREVIKEFYEPFKENLDKKDKELSKKELTEEKTDEVCEKCDSPMIIKMGRYGKFLACSNYPECKNTKNITQDKDGKEIIEEPELTDEICEKCNAQMQKKRGKYGPFLGCSNYPKCKNIINIEISTNVKCQQCEKGEIIEKRSRYGKIFYACNQYPKCKFALWSRPTGDKCAVCNSLMVFGAKNTTRCSNRECSKIDKKAKK
ncbi:MAG: type I DNA topoisomerase [bacterium]